MNIEIRRYSYIVIPLFHVQPNIYYFLTTLGNGLECYFCLSDDHNLGDCDSEHAGSPVICSDNPDDLHYGDKCSVGHTSNYCSIVDICRLFKYNLVRQFHTT